MYNLVTPTICLHSSTIEYAGVWRWKDIMDCSYLVDLLAIWLVDITHNALYSRLKSCVPLVHFTSFVLFLMNNLRFHSNHTHLSWPGHTLARRDITPFLQDQYLYLSHILESAISFPCLYIYTWHPIVVECIPCYSECYFSRDIIFHRIILSYVSTRFRCCLHVQCSFNDSHQKYCIIWNENNK